VSILVQSIIDDASQRITDPNKGRIVQARWLQFYNDAIEHMTQTYKLLEQDATHDLQANEDRYLYPPDDFVQMKRWRYTDTPSDPTTYRDSRERKEDQFRAETDWTLPQGDTGFRYWARAQFFQITPRPTVDVAAGGLITYWRLATTSTAPATDVFELSAALRRFVRDRMVISAKQELKRNEEWPNDLAVWKSDIEAVYDRIEDRSDDAPETLRLKSAHRPFSRMN
jgi:hypothetical protein